MRIKHRFYLNFGDYRLQIFIPLHLIKNFDDYEYADDYLWNAWANGNCSYPVNCRFAVWRQENPGVDERPRKRGEGF